MAHLPSVPNLTLNQEDKEVDEKAGHTIFYDVAELKKIQSELVNSGLDISAVNINPHELPFIDPEGAQT
ncbi:hypothetical protein ABFO59_06310 [Acinetobacter radioresistens]|uniref:hypothetical protein n=1 Tax=Acinetobacter radioresistens TaxID=40216 RepID=UPI0032151131